jgi:hypothetical protein
VGDRARRHRLPGLPIVDVVAAPQRAIAFPGTIGARLAAGAAELDAGDRVLLLDEFDQTAERFDERIVPDAEIAERAAAAPLDLGRFDHHEPGAAGRELAGVHQVPVGRKALVGRILMHRRHHDAILEPDIPKVHRLKQHRSGHPFSPHWYRGRDDIGRGPSRKGGNPALAARKPCKFGMA